MNNNYFYTRKKVGGLERSEKVGRGPVLTVQEAKKYNIEIREIPDAKVFQASYKGQTAYFRFQNPSHTKLIGYLAATNKNIGKAFLRRAGLSTPNGFTILRSDEKAYWKEVFDSLKKPLVVKPTHGMKGQSVFMDIQSFETFSSAIEQCLSYSSDTSAGAIVEELFEGKEYRILTTQEKVIGIIHRIPANVVGNGKSTIQELIDEKNSDPRREDLPDFSIVAKIMIDEHILAHLAAHGLSLTSVPQKNQLIYLRLNSNISTGGDSIDMTDAVHPSVKEIALRTIAAYPGLMYAGIDFMTTDITAQQTPESYRIIEVNDTPGHAIHDRPFEGKNRHAAYEFLCLLFPELRHDFSTPLE